MAIVPDLSNNNRNVDKHVTSDSAIRRSYAVTPADGTDLPNGSTVAVLVGVAGDVKVTYVDGQIDTVSLAASVWHPMDVTRIWSTGTTATSIKAGY